jgi:hypothetical protein
VDPQLRTDQYCGLGNQLHYIARSSADPTAVTLDLSNGSNLDTHPRHFHSTVWHLIDANHHTQNWELMPTANPRPFAWSSRDKRNSLRNALTLLLRKRPVLGGVNSRVDA